MPVILPVGVPHAPAHHQPAPPAPTASTDRPAAKNPGTAAKTPARTTRTVVIHAGDTIYAIARREHSTVAAITKANSGLDARHLVPGTRIKVPVPTPSRPKSANKPKPAASSHPAMKAPTKPSIAHAPRPTHVVTYAGTKAAKGYPKDLVAAGDAHRKQLATTDQPTREQLHDMIVTTAKRYGVSPVLALAIGWQESGFQQSAVSVCDAIGTMQVMPDTGTWAGSLLDKKLDIMKAQDNITAGVTTLRFLTQHAENQDEAIGAYYQGLGAMQEHGPYDDTKQYVASVKAHMTRFAHS